MLLFENCSFYYDEEAKSDRPFIVMVFVLAVALAFETGVLTVVWSLLAAFYNTKESNKSERRRVHYYKSYRNED